MKRLAVIVLVAATSAGGGWLAGRASDPTADPPVVHEITARTFPVTRVIDGDTIVILYDGEATSVRLAGIDTPERGQPGFDEATDAMRAMVEGRAVTIAFADPARKRDNFGRLLAHVYAEGVDVGREMLERGLAEVYRSK